MSHPTSSTPSAATPPERQPRGDALDPDSTAATGDRGLSGEIFRALPVAVRGTLLIALGLVVALIVASLAGAWWVRHPLPDTSGELVLEGLHSPVTVYRDDRGVPTLVGEHDLDLFRAQGFVHAQDRFFEMDLRRHSSAGRLAELFGEPMLQADKLTRTMGWRRVAAEELARLDLNTRDALEAYAAGVNAYLAQRSATGLGFEYTMLRLGGLSYRPEPWTPVDSLTWLKSMAWDLNGGTDHELGRVAALLSHTPAEVAQLYPEYDASSRQPIMEQGAVVDGVFDQDATRNATRWPTRPSYPWAARSALVSTGSALAELPSQVGRGDAIGSNSWVVSAQRSTTGAPLLANDPHFGLSQPGVLVQGGLKCRVITSDCALDVTGFGFAGVPGIVIGHNADIAWGVTNLPADSADFFLERVHDSHTRFGDRWEPLRVRHETITVRGGADFELTVRESRHGPLISDVSAAYSTLGANSPAEDPDLGDPVVRDPDRGPPQSAPLQAPYAVALKWTGLEPASTMDGLLGLNRARSFDQFRQAATKITSPSLSLVYADTAGHIGYQATGKIPVRRAGRDGTLPVEGWLPANEWTGTSITDAALPNVIDPNDGILVAANQQVIGSRYPYRLGTGFDQGYRAQRARELLDSGDPISPAQMAGIQRDTHNPLAAELVPALLRVDPGQGTYRQAQRLLADWNFHDDADSPAATYFNATWAALLRLTFDDELTGVARPDGGARWVRVVSDLLAEPTSSWWDDKRTKTTVETRDDIVRQALREARVQLTSVRSPEVNDWSWGALHRLEPRHPVFGDSRIGLLRWLFNGDNVEAAGGTAAVNATGWETSAVTGSRSFDVTTGPAMRMVVDLGDLESSRWVGATGVSGHPGSSHYQDQSADLVRGQTHPWPFALNQVREAADDTLRLMPG